MARSSKETAPTAKEIATPLMPNATTTPNAECDSTPSKVKCTQAIPAIRDTLYVVGGKWKLPIIMALFEGPLRFKELQKVLEDITPKILSKELKDLELNEFVTRTVYATSPVTVEYKLTAYSHSLKKVLLELRDWGLQHRRRLKESSKARRLASQS